MIKITIREPEDKKWTDWKDRCKKATAQLIDDYNTRRAITITDLYKELKDIFFKHDDYFFGKCVYCESLIPNSNPGDIEHFRPKGKVTDLNDKLVMVSVDGKEVPHPGYYWLAYDVNNLMPSCIDCNRPSSGNSAGKKIGKWMKFPVNGKHAFKPGDELNEEPLLINPIIDNPSEHLEIDSLCLIHKANNSIKGQTTIDVFGLNDRPSLVNERKETYKQVRNEVKLAYISIMMKSPDSQLHLDRIRDYKQGKRPYSLAARKAIEDEKADIQNQIATI